MVNAKPREMVLEEGYPIMKNVALGRERDLIRCPMPRHFSVLLTLLESSLSNAKELFKSNNWKSSDNFRFLPQSHYYQLPVNSFPMNTAVQTISNERIAQALDSRNDYMNLALIQRVELQQSLPVS